MDYEGVPFRCRRCFKTGHNAASYDRGNVERSASRWKGITPQFYTVDKEVNQIPPQGLGGLRKNANALVSEIDLNLGPTNSNGGLPGFSNGGVKDDAHLGCSSNQSGREVAVELRA
ncbi:hypothetical protein SUGI_0490800 [Cryptomeria japonica]|nr:hypothetical protein SUGI_0490800 [Cryptomeria japonica]